MKTRHLMMMMAAALIAGCSENEVTMTTPESDQVIGFKVYTGLQNRGTATTTDEIQKLSRGFGVCAYRTTADYATSLDPKDLYMDNTQVTYDGTSTSWTYSPLRYWPTNATDKISFFAYAPYNAEGIELAPATTTADPLLKFTLQDRQIDMVDLVSDAQKNQTSTTAATSSGKITFNLKHRLSRVGMQAKVDKDLTGNGLTKVFITGIKFTQAASTLYKTANLNLSDGTWDTTGGTAISSPYELKSTKTDGGILNNYVAANFADYTTKSIDISNFTAFTSLFPEEQYLFFIPAGATGTSGAGDVKIEISYDIVTKASYGATTAVVSKNTKEIELAANSFTPGTAYLYKFTVGLTGIEFSATVDAWGVDTEVTPNI